MAITAKSIIQRAAETLQDLGGVRWTSAELVRYLNDGQREICVYRPDATEQWAEVSCVAGPRQTLPDDGAKLIDITRNTSLVSQRNAIRMVDRSLLTSQVPGWYSEAQAADIVHYMYDARDPKIFFVYPPASTSAKIEILYSAYPVDIDEPTSGVTYTSVSGDISVADQFANALTDYVLYRAFTKDAEMSGTAGRAQAHYAQFANAIGIELKSTAGVAPMLSGKAGVQ
jgi:hypothetical protein